MPGLNRRIVTGLLFLVALGGCAAQSGDSSDVPVAAAQDQGGRENPAETAFLQNCAGCHGTDLAGGRAYSLFNNSMLRERSDVVLHDTILEGIAEAGMPSFRDVLDDETVWQLITYIRNEASSLGTPPEFVPDPDGSIVTSGGQSARLEVLAKGLEVPWAIEFLPDGRMLVTERAGRLRILENDKLLDKPVTGTPTVHVGQDAGMLDITLHPDYVHNGWIYLAYVELLPGLEPEAPQVEEPGVRRRVWPPSMTVIVRGRINANDEWVDNEVLFRGLPETYTTTGMHYGSRLLFDPGGNLLFSIGDRGDPARAQDLSSPLGKIHRITDDGKVPADNPFVGVPGALPTIWSYGHRNPQGLAFDPGTGLLWESEHGPTGGDEINIIEPGGNYGWAEVTNGLERGITRRSAPGMIDPIAYYTPSIAPSGICFCDLRRYPGWSGGLLVAALGGQQLRRLEISGREIVAQDVIYDRFGRTREAAVGPDGMLYVLLQYPTGSGTGLRLSAATPGVVARLVPLD